MSVRAAFSRASVTFLSSKADNSSSFKPNSSFMSILFCARRSLMFFIRDFTFCSMAVNLFSSPSFSARKKMSSFWVVLLMMEFFSLKTCSYRAFFKLEFSSLITLASDEIFRNSELSFSSSVLRFEFSLTRSLASRVRHSVSISAASSFCRTAIFLRFPAVSIFYILSVSFVSCLTNYCPFSQKMLV